MKMKPYHSALIFFVFIVSAIAASISSYHRTMRDIECDMDRALVITLNDCQDQWLTPDTIRSYRSHLSIELLKESSTLCYVVDDRRYKGRSNEPKANGNSLTSKAMSLNSHAVRGYANCSMADILGMSDQRMPLSILLMAMLWATCATMYHRRRNDISRSTMPLAATCCPADAGSTRAQNGMHGIGSLCYSDDDDSFRDSKTLMPVCFTPMQHLLMRMFFDSDNHRLTKQEISETLWPKKPDASETLYTLIRRTKPVAERHGVRIVSERGKAYHLTAE